MNQGNSRFRRVAAFGALLLAACAGPQGSSAASERAAAEWRKVDASTRAIADVAALEQLARDIPNSSTVHLALLNAYLDTERLDEAWNEIELLSSRGYTFSAAGQAGLLEIYEGVARQKLAELFGTDRGRREASSPFATVPADAQLIEGVALDPATGRLFASSIISRALFVRAAEGGWGRVAIPGAGSLAGLALDSAGRTLWVASGVYEETPNAERSYRGLIGLNLDNGELTRIPAPDGATPSDIALATDGTLYASDPLTGAIYRAARGDETLSIWIAPGTFRSPQGLVPWPGGGLLVSDYGYGLAFVDAAARAWRVESDVPVLLDGIDGMWRHGDKVVAVQNGARPPRIVELTIAATGRRVTGMRELERAHSAWTEPVGGAIAGDALIYIANSQWGAFGEDGTLRDGAVPQATELRALPLLETPAPPP